MKEEIKFEDMDKTTSVETLIKYFEQLGIDKCIRKELTSYEQGEQVGSLKIIDVLKLICKG